MVKYSTIQVPTKFRKKIDKLIADDSQGYSSVAEYVKDLIRSDLLARGLLYNQVDNNNKTKTGKGKQTLEEQGYVKTGETDDGEPIYGKPNKTAEEHTSEELFIRE